MVSPTADSFAALARSSPWRWTTLRFTVSWVADHPTWPEPVRAWLRRPDALRVETLAGEVLQAGRSPRQEVGVLTADGGRTVALPWATEGPAPELRPDGLVAGPVQSWAPPFDDPMFTDYRWVAMLAPFELADGRDLDTGELAGPPVEVDDPREVGHGGRPAWEAVVRPTQFYEPRCGCCPLLRTRLGDDLEWGRALLDAYPEAYRVRLDVGTGVSVRTEAVGGSITGAGHDLRIEAVDEPMSDTLFVDPRRRRRWLRRPGWAPLP